MKFTKFIPLALALTIAVTPVFAEGEQGTRTQTETYNINVPEYFNITKVGTAIVNGGTVTVDTDMSGLHWGNPMGVTYKVVNNKPAKTFYLKATCPVGSTAGTLKAFATGFDSSEGGAAGANTTKIAFSNVNATSVPDQTAVNDALSATPTKANNKNVIAAQFSCAAVTPTDGGVINSRTIDGQEIVYSIESGTYQFAYSIGQDALGGTFSPHDEMGTYRATLTITDVASGS